MNRPALEALRGALEPYPGPGGLRVAMGKLLDALLAPDAVEGITCTTCGRVAQPGAVLKIVGPSARVCCPLCAPAPTLSNKPARPVALWETA